MATFKTEERFEDYWFKLEGMTAFDSHKRVDFEISPDKNYRDKIYIVVKDNTAQYMGLFIHPDHAEALGHMILRAVELHRGVNTDSFVEGEWEI